MSKSQRQNSVASNASVTSDVNSVIRGLEYIESKYNIATIVSNIVKKMVDDSNLTNNLLKELVKNLKGNYATDVTIYKSVLTLRLEVEKANTKKEKANKTKIAVPKASTRGSTNATTYNRGTRQPPQMNNRLLSSEESDESSVSSKPNSNKPLDKYPNVGIAQRLESTSEEEDVPANNTRSRVDNKTRKPRTQQLNSDEEVNNILSNTRNKTNSKTTKPSNNNPSTFNNNNLSSDECC